MVSRIIKMELPCIITKCLVEYEKLREKVGSASFWQFCPEIIKDAQEDTMRSGNLVYRFLLAGPDGNCSKTARHYVRMVKGSMTNWEDFKNAFDKYISFKHKNTNYNLSTSELAPFLRLGYTLVKKKMCTICRKPSAKGCCEGYSKANRVERTWITDMEIVHEEL